MPEYRKNLTVRPGPFKGPAPKKKFVLKKPAAAAPPHVPGVVGLFRVQAQHVNALQPHIWWDLPNADGHPMAFTVRQAALDCATNLGRVSAGLRYRVVEVIG